MGTFKTNFINDLGEGIDEALWTACGWIEEFALIYISVVIIVNSIW